MIEEENVGCCLRNVSPRRALFINCLYPTHLNPTILWNARIGHQRDNKCYVDVFKINKNLWGNFFS